MLVALDAMRPGDVPAAVADAEGRGKAWRVALRRGAALLRRVDAKAASTLGVGE
jgi:hypothetical protein